MIRAEDLVDRLRERLLAEAAPDGGWPYLAGRRPRIEPTSWAVLALAESGDRSQDATNLVTRHVDWLQSRPRAEGLLTDEEAQPANIGTNGLAACVLDHVGPEKQTTDGGAPVLAGALVSVSSLSIPTPGGELDGTLRAWPWIAGTFSWVEPTAWTMLALKRTARRVAGDSAAQQSGQKRRTKRIRRATRMLVDRACPAGGWNYGNGRTLGQDLRPYVPTTALALLALGASTLVDRTEDRARASRRPGGRRVRTRDVVDRGLAYLEGNWRDEPSPLALSLAAVCLHVFGRPTEPLLERLSSSLERTERRGDLLALAMALYACSLAAHDAEVFRV